MFSILVKMLNWAYAWSASLRSVIVALRYSLYPSLYSKFAAFITLMMWPLLFSKRSLLRIFHIIRPRKHGQLLWGSLWPVWKKSSIVCIIVCSWFFPLTILTPATDHISLATRHPKIMCDKVSVSSPQTWQSLGIWIPLFLMFSATGNPLLRIFHQKN